MVLFEYLSTSSVDSLFNVFAFPNQPPSINHHFSITKFFILSILSHQKKTKNMKNPTPSIVDDDDNAPPNCWWRSTALYEEYVKLKLDPSTVRDLKPELRVLRELERLAVAAPEGLNELRDKLFGYKAGDLWVPTGGIRKEELDIPPVISILLVGFIGSGKSSLVNLMYSVLSRSGLILFAKTSSGNSRYPTTQYMEENNVLRSMENGFCVFDSRGFEYNRVKDGLEELSYWMAEGIRHNQPCSKSVVYGITDNDTLIETDYLKSEAAASASALSRFVNRKVNCAMVVVNMAEIYGALKDGDSKHLEATKQFFCSPDLRKCNEGPILILTHGDLLSAEERIDARLKLCKSLGISETEGVYDIECLTEYGFIAEESDPVTAYAVCEAIYRALLFSDRGYLPKNSFTEWGIVILAWLLYMMGTLFAFLAHIFSTFEQKVEKLKKLKKLE